MEGFCSRISGRYFVKCANVRYPLLSDFERALQKEDGSYAEEIDYLKHWLTDRAAWLDTQWLK